MRLKLDSVANNLYRRIMSIPMLIDPLIVGLTFHPMRYISSIDFGSALSAKTSLDRSSPSAFISFAMSWLVIPVRYNNSSTYILSSKTYVRTKDVGSLEYPKSSPYDINLASLGISLIVLKLYTNDRD